MEPAKINWKAIESVYVRDETYENINAPKWVDFLAPDDAGVYTEDESWFCRSDCKHPKTAEDFLRSTPTSKLLRSASVSKLIGLGNRDWNWTSSREVNNPKTRGRIECLSGGCEDGENQNPNLATPPQSSATVKDEEDNNSLMLKPEENRRLKSTLSARDLFGGGRGLIIVNKITEFCNELKRMATISTSTTTNQMLQQEEETMKAKDTQVEDELLVLGNSNESVKREEIAAGEDNHKKKPRFVDTENVPVVNGGVQLKLDLKQQKKKNSSREIIRTSPPTPQCFSATTSNKPKQSSSSSRIPKSTKLLLKERQPFKELVLEHMTTTPTKPKQEHELEREDKEEQEEEELVKSNYVKKKKNNDNSSSSSCTSGLASKEGRAALVDVFWLFKPCALSSSS